jgi:hypothetical protein
MIRGRQLDRPLPDEGGERVEGRHSARDYRDLRNQMLNTARATVSAPMALSLLEGSN